MKQGFANSLQTINARVAEGDTIQETDTGRTKTGNGTSRWNDLAYDDSSQPTQVNITTGPTDYSSLRNTPSLGSAAYLNTGTGSGSVPTVPLPMSVMPMAKSRIDVHHFSFTVGPTARRSGAFTLSIPPGASNFFNVVAYQSATPGTNKGVLPDSREFDQLSITSSITSDTTLKCSWVATGPVIGNFNGYYQFKN